MLGETSLISSAHHIWESCHNLPRFYTLLAYIPAGSMACLTGNAGTTVLVLSLPLNISTHDESSIGTEFGEKLMIKMDRTQLL